MEAINSASSVDSCALPPCAACAAMAFLPGRLAQVLLEPVAGGIRFLVVGCLVGGLTLAGGVVVLCAVGFARLLTRGAGAV